MNDRQYRRVQAGLGQHRPGQGLQVWDDEQWEEVWERGLGQVERHALAVDLLRGRTGGHDLFRQRIIAELARRWRRQARNLMVLWGLWCLFWGRMLVEDVRLHHEVTSASVLSMLVVGAVVLGGCMALRDRVRDAARRRP